MLRVEKHQALLENMLRKLKMCNHLGNRLLKAWEAKPGRRWVFFVFGDFGAVKSICVLGNLESHMHARDRKYAQKSPETSLHMVAWLVYRLCANRK